MSKQLKTPTLTGSPISVWFDIDFDQYEVRIAGKPKATYHTDSKSDALQTAQYMRNNSFCPPAQKTAAKSLAVPAAALAGIPAFESFLVNLRSVAVADLEAGNASGNMDARIAAMTDLAKVTAAIDLLTHWQTCTAAGVLS